MSLPYVTSEGRARIVVAIHEATVFRLDRDSIRLENRAHALAIDMGRQSFLMQLGFDTDVLEHDGLVLSTLRP